jgi:hypothetical protein
MFQELKNSGRASFKFVGCLFGFRNRINFLAQLRRIGEKLFVIEGDVWLRKTARAAAVADTLLDLWTSAVSPKVWHLSV